jgi:hypothetical protein
MYYSDYEDTRGCTNNCSCSPSGKHCDNTVVLLGINDDCNDLGSSYLRVASSTSVRSPRRRTTR